MQTFYEHLQEDNSSVDNLGHNMPMSPKRKKVLNADRGVFKDFPVQQWTEYRPYANSSVTTKQELKILQSYEVYRDNAREFMELVDQKLMKPFKNYYKENDLPMKDLEDVIKLKDQLAPIVLQLKIHYNRPRPQKLSKVLTFFRQASFNVYPLKTAETPSYPSGHATEGRFVSLYLADKVPFEHKGNIKKIGDDIGNSRQIAGVHYPSDTEFGHQLASAFYSHYKEKSGIKETKLHFHGISLTEEAFTIPINEPKDIDSFPTDLDKGQLKKLLKYLKSQTEVVPIAGGNEGGIKVRISDTETKDWVKQNINLKLKYGKGSLGKEPSPSGEDWEAMITVGQRTRKGKDPSKETPDEWDRVSRKELWTGTLITQSETLAKEFDKIGLPNLTQTGSGKGGGKVSKEWSKWGGKNATPKTDIKSGKKRISLKKAGGSQVMSAKAPEGIATFNAAAKMMGKNAPKETAKIIDFMQNETMDLTGSGYKGSVTDLEKELENSKGNPQKMKNLKPFKDELDATRKNIGTLTSKIVKVFNDNPTFKKHFVFEAATGQVKFGDTSPSRADVMVEFDDIKGKINHNYSLKTVNESDVQTLANLYKFYAAFKSAGKSSPYISIRGAVTKTPQQVMNFTKKILSDEYEKDTHMTFSSIINDALTMNEYGRKMLHENSIEQLDEFALFDKIKKGLSNVNKKVRDKFTQMFNWIKEKVNNAFNWIKKQGEKMLSLILKFFNIQVTSVKLTGKGPELFTQ